MYDESYGIDGEFSTAGREVRKLKSMLNEAQTEIEKLKEEIRDMQLALNEANDDIDKLEAEK